MEEMKIPDDALRFIAKHQCKVIVYTMGDGTRVTDADIAQALLDARSEIADLASSCSQCKEPVWCEVKGEAHTLRAQLAEAQAENDGFRSMMKSEVFDGLSTEQLIFIIHSMQDERAAKCLEYETVIEKLKGQLEEAGKALSGLGYTPSADDSGSYDSLVPDEYL